MKVVIPFLIVLSCVQLFAETWKESNIFHGWENRFSSQKVYFSNSTEQTLKAVDYEVEIQNPYFVFFFDNLPGGARFLSIQNDDNESNDSIWISKYWMEDSLLNTPVVAEENLNLDDFRLLKMDSTHRFEISSIMDERIEIPFETVRLQRFNSIYFVYKKDTSYYAYCLAVTGAPIGCDFILSCVFQNDGTLNFGEIPSAGKLSNGLDGCPTSALTPSVGRMNVQKRLPSYKATGRPANETSSGVTHQNGISKLNLKK